MSMDRSEVRVRHMLDAAKEVLDFTRDHHRIDLDTDQMLLRALSMSMGIIGEAPSHLDEKFRSDHSHIPWRQIIGLRNFLFHEYFRVDHDIIWNTATESVPALIPQLEQLLSDITSKPD